MRFFSEKQGSYLKKQGCFCIKHGCFLIKMETFSRKQDISIVKHDGVYSKVPMFLRIHAHEREHRRPRTRVLLTGNSGHKCPKPWAKLGKALCKVVHCGLTILVDHFLSYL